ncbi:Hypothetical protein (plasmid) [Pseudomonas putida]|uniref:Plasmid mobilization relaxosome protein MobC n=8 Tax=Gammaproteobacteria TaxID=1236 RepID=A0A8E4T7I1_ECOLX|nr:MULTISPECIES: hypothetical protein [Gammaproteobacteria]AKJ19260.1 hypothetical protein [Enterobacter cloacae]ALP55315.1 RND divalent metal cation efflux [Klebsiella pneumoniae subsp. pneumoniae]AUR79996.1 hypothetical protein pCf587_0217 [Citrobacter freundii]QAX89207.1 hypothetical protein SGI1-PmCA14_040 [Proteus mirabilis]QFX76464.1 hypothetical protein [Pseudomonas monteilii]QHW09089.1 hypothetical protein [Enterobacteriaceae bacterium]QIZ22603.1 Hypothetical protein [Pseudomonas put
MAVVQPAPDSSISEVICTNLDYAQYSCAPKRGEHGDGGSVAKIGGSQR